LRDGPVATAAAKTEATAIAMSRSVATATAKGFAVGRRCVVPSCGRRVALAKSKQQKHSKLSSPSKNN
jgi:hypothetical protein